MIAQWHETFLCTLFYPPLPVPLASLMTIPWRPMPPALVHPTRFRKVARNATTQHFVYS